MKLHEFQLTSHNLFPNMLIAEYFFQINVQETILFLGLWSSDTHIEAEGCFW